MAREQTLADKISGSSVWRSVVRHGYPDTQRNQALIIASNVFLHIHPVKIKRYATKVTYTFCLGGLSFFMFLVLVGTKACSGKVGHMVGCGEDIENSAFELVTGP